MCGCKVRWAYVRISPMCFFPALVSCVMSSLELPKKVSVSAFRIQGRVLALVSILSV